jgi:hypothetical protein
MNIQLSCFIPLWLTLHDYTQGLHHQIENHSPHPPPPQLSFHLWAATHETMHGRTPAYHRMSPATVIALMHSMLGITTQNSLLPSKWTVTMISSENKSLMKQQLVVTHTIHQTEVPALEDSWVTNIPSIKMSCPQKIAFPYISLKT